MGFLSRLTDAVGLTNTKAEARGVQAANLSMLRPSEFSGFGGRSTLGFSPEGFAQLQDQGALDRFAPALTEGARKSFAGLNALAPISSGLNTLQNIGFGGINQLSGATPDLSGFTGVNPIAQAFAGLGLGAGVQASRGFGDIANDQLGLLREQAAPFEERSFNTLQQRLFNQGRLGGTQESRALEGFSRGLGQADLGRQLAAFDTAQSLQNAATQRATAFGGLGEQLLQGSFGRTLQGSDLAARRVQDRFGQALQLFNAQQQARQAQLGEAGGFLGLFGGLEQASQARGTSALNAAIARANAASGAGQVLAQAPQGGSPLGSLIGVGAGLLGFSDERLKDNLYKVGEVTLPVYEWKWNAEALRVGAGAQPERGILAQDIEKVAPGTIVTDSSGYKKVRYYG